MESEHIDTESIVHDRRVAVAESIREIGTSDLKALVERLFPDVTHPWLEPFRHFVEENAGCLFYHAATHDGVEIVYCRAKEKGIWFVPGVGTGILQPRALEALREIVDAG